MASDTLQISYDMTAVQQKINKIEQKLFWYDNVPEDARIVELIKQWREYRRELEELQKALKTGSLLQATRECYEIVRNGVCIGMFTEGNVSRWDGIPVSRETAYKEFEATIEKRGTGDRREHWMLVIHKPAENRK